MHAKETVNTSYMKVNYFYCTAAAAAKSLQSCPTLCDPIDGSPPRRKSKNPRSKQESQEALKGTVN